MVRFLTLLMLLLASQVMAASQGQAVVAKIEGIPSTGMGDMLLERAYQELGLTLKTMTLPSRQALRLANLGMIDGDMFRVSEVVEPLYPNLVRVPYPLLRGSFRVVTLDADITHWDKARFIREGRRVAVRRGVLMAEALADGLNVIHTNDYDQLASLVRLGRVDLALFSDIEGFGPHKATTWHDLRVLDEPALEYDLYHYVHRKHRARAVALAAVLRRMDESGERQRIIEAFIARWTWSD